MKKVDLEISGNEVKVIEFQPGTLSPVFFLSSFPPEDPYIIMPNGSAYNFSTREPDSLDRAKQYASENNGTLFYNKDVTFPFADFVEGVKRLAQNYPQINLEWLDAELEYLDQVQPIFGKTDFGSRMAVGLEGVVKHDKPYLINLDLNFDSYEEENLSILFRSLYTDIKIDPAATPDLADEIEESDRYEDFPRLSTHFNERENETFRLFMDSPAPFATLARTGLGKKVHKIDLLTTKEMLERFVPLVERINKEYTN